MKQLFVLLVVMSLVVFWVMGDMSNPFHVTTGLGKEVYSKEDKQAVEASTTALLVEVNATSSATTSVPVISHVATPEHVRAIYMSSWVAGTPSVRARLIKLIDDTELNAVVIDVKDNTGVLSWDGRIRDLDVLMKELHDKNIYVIARIAAFQDPVYVKLHPEQAVKNVKTGTVWRDHKGVPWVDTGSHDMWAYLVDIGKASHDKGFDELNYDYIRFPTDGDLSAMRFPISGERGLVDKRGVVQEFYKYLHDQFSPLAIPISGDLFGIIATNANETKTLGQDLGDALTYFNYVALMVYPSHFYAGTAGYQNPAAHPGEIITYSTRGAISIAVQTASSTVVATGTPKVASSTLIAKLRPWYQDFDMGAVYTKEMVRAQMDAGYNFNIDSWMLWDPSNRYTPAALKSK
jgi:hypothetical protein